MAWDDYERDGHKLWGGDAPLDELAVALIKIGEAYQARFSRMPYVDELLLSLEQLLASNPDRFVEDPAGMKDARIQCSRPAAKPRKRIDFNAYEAYYTDVPDPGYYGIERRSDKAKVLRMPKVEVIERRLEIDYEILDPQLVGEDDSVIRLIKRAFLREFLDSAYGEEADALVFRNLASGATQRMPYDEA